jgi:O-acetyl-ADP-ribose deacetylase (regulator of RNase III)
MKATLNDISIELLIGDITDLKVDAIVNAANSHLVLGGGVAGAIRLKGGPTIQQECYKIGHCEVGQAVITGAGTLPARCVIHAVAPSMGEGNEQVKLAGATRAALYLADKNGMESIALPALSSGVFGYPLEECAKVMLEEIVITTFDKEIQHLKRMIVCLFDERAYHIFAAHLQTYLNGLA